MDSLLTLAQTTTYDTLKIESYNIVISALISGGEFLKADSLLEVISKLSVGKFQNKVAMIYLYSKGYISELTGAYPKALEYYFKALKSAEEAKNFGYVASLYNNIGLIYFSQKEYNHALDYYLKAITTLQTNGITRGLGTYYNNIGNIYYTRKDYKQALEYYNLSLEIRQASKNFMAVASTKNNIGSVYLELKEYDKALTYFQEAFEAQEKANDKFDLLYSYLNIGSVYWKKGNFPLAEKNLIQGLAIANEIKFPDAFRDSYSSLSEMYEAKGDGNKALKYYKLFVSYRDSIANESQLKEINQREMSNEFSKKEILLKAEQEKQNIEHSEKEKRNKILLYSTLLLMLIIIGFSVSLFNRYKLSQTQKKIIESRNREVMDSINYAQRLQNAILIPEQELLNHFSDAFILFNPKDIVSGDFYWFSESEKNKIIALADCTGHGVPGGFMSMLGYESLQDVALKENITTTSEALKSLDKKITDTLNKSDRSFRDGMDIALCAFSKSDNKLQYSGANRPLLHISNGVLTEYKPDKNTIGGDIDNIEKIYSTKTIETKKGDVFYMLTDGYPDQFGGPDGKKFKYKNLQSILVSISSLPLKQQKEHLQKTFNDWRGGLEQIDDVSIIGLKI